MKYCKYCGAEIPDGGICTCAEAQNEAVSSKASSGKSVIIYGVVIVSVIIIAIGLFSSFLGGGYKKPVDLFFKGFNKCDSSMIAKSLPESSADEFEKQMSDEDLETIINILEAGYGESLKISYDIEDKESLDKKKIKSLETSTKLDIKKAYNLTIEIKFKGKKNDKETTTNLTVAKIKGEGWKLLGDVTSLLG